MTNSPFLSSEVFANLTDMKIFSRRDLDRKLYKIRPEVKSLFISSDLIDLLNDLQHFLPNLDVLVSGHSDRNFKEETIIPESVKVWYSQNNAISGDARVRLLPIGLENLSLGRGGRKKYFKLFHSNKIENRVLVPPFSPTNSIRKKVVLECRKNAKVFDVVTQMTYEREYFNLIGRYRYVLCLEGNGFDTHRLWETLYLGSFPVVLKSDWSIKLNALNLPILIVDSIDEINYSLLVNFTENNANFEPNNCEILWSSYWAKCFRNRAI